MIHSLDVSQSCKNKNHSDNEAFAKLIHLFCFEQMYDLNVMNVFVVIEFAMYLKRFHSVDSLLRSALWRNIMKSRKAETRKKTMLH